MSHRIQISEALRERLLRDMLAFVKADDKVNISEHYYYIARRGIALWEINDFLVANHLERQLDYQTDILDHRLL